MQYWVVRVDALQGYLYMRMLEACPVSQLARKVRAVIEHGRQRRKPIVITQRGREVAVLVPVELYREMERRALRWLPSPRLADRADAPRFRMEMSIIDQEGRRR